MAWAKFIRSSECGPTVNTTLTVREIGDSDRNAFGQTAIAGFGMPAPMAEWLAAIVGQPRWHAYVSYDSATPVGAGALYVDGDFAWCGIGSTISGARKRGGQSAMLARRIADAASFGAKFVVTETGVPNLAHWRQATRTSSRVGSTWPTCARTGRQRAKRRRTPLSGSFRRSPAANGVQARRTGWRLKSDGRKHDAWAGAARSGRSLPAHSAILLLNLFVGSPKVPAHLRSARLRIGIAPKWRRIGLLSSLALLFCEIVAVAFVGAAEAVVRHNFVATSRLVELQAVHSVFNLRMAPQRAIALLNFMKGVQNPSCTRSSS